MITFRPHRSTVAEAMAEAVAVSDRDALMRHIAAVHSAVYAAIGLHEVPFDPSKVTFKRQYDGPNEDAKRWYNDDGRIGWKDIHVVGYEGYGVLGFCTFEPVAVTT